MLPRRRKSSTNDHSQSAYDKAMRLFPGGVNSPVRAYGAVGGTPRFIAHGKGAILTDLDGCDYIDYVGSWGPLILGHADERVVAAIVETAAKGTTFGAPTELETRLAERVAARVPSIDMMRFVSSGTEAVMSAVRLARAFTQRNTIIKFEGCYHGHADSLLVEAGSGAITFGVPSSPGIPAGATKDTNILPYNDLAAARNAFEQSSNDVAAVLIEPVAGNMGLVLPKPGYLSGLRELCDQYGSLLVFDEVMTGFRVAWGGAQQLVGVRPDLTCLGKIIGGGLPAAAYGGRGEIMRMISPLGPVYQAGTLSGNPLAMAAGIATLEALDDPGVYERIGRTTGELADGLKRAAHQTGTSLQVESLCGMVCAFFSRERVDGFASAKRCDTTAYAAWFHAMLNRGIYLPPSQFECWFVSLAHSNEDIEYTVYAAKEAFEEIASSRQPERIS